jgi:hypothetical protein
MFLGVGQAMGGGDIFDGYIQINSTWYNIGGVNDGRDNPVGSANAETRMLLSNQDFGTQTFGSFNITGFQIYGYTTSGTSVDNNGANFKVWRSGDAEPSYSNFWNTTSESYYSGPDYTSSVTGQSRALIGDTFINGDTYNLKIQTYTVLTGDNSGSKFYERSDSFVVNGARQQITGSADTTQSAAYNTSAGGGIVKQGTGKLTLSKDNSNATTGQKGDIYIDAGTVAVNPETGSITGDQALGGSSTTVRLGAESGTSAATFALADSDGGLTVSRSIVARAGSSGTLTISGANTAGVNTVSGSVFLDNSVTFSAASGGILDISGQVQDGAGAGTFGAAVNAAGTVRLSGSGANSGTSWTVQAGTLELSKNINVNAVAGALTVNSGAKLLLSSSGNVADTSAVTLSGGTIQRASGVSETFGNLTISEASTLDFGSGAATAGTLQFQTYSNSGSSPVTVSNFSVGNKLQFLSSNFNSGNLAQFAFSNGYTTSTEGSYFTITAIPEPSTYVAVAGLLAMFLWPVRRRVMKDVKSILGLRPTGRERIEAYRKA